MKRIGYITININVFAVCATACALILCIVLTVYIGFSRRAVSTEAAAENELVIIIDAGHGGIDGGTQSADGMLEKDVNLAIARSLNSMLNLLGYKTVMTRTEDEPVYDDPNASVRAKKISDTRNRMSIIESYTNAIFVSIHQNYFSQTQYNGAQVFYSGNNDASSTLAQCIQDSIVGMIQADNTRKIKQCGTEVYLMYHCPLPAAMVECGFLSNTQEAALLSDETYRRKVALSILNGIMNYIGTDTRILNVDSRIA